MMNKELLGRISHIKGKIIDSETHCPKSFKCVEFGCDNLCEAVDIGMETYLKCLDNHPLKCPFSVSFAGDFFCKCPLRVYLNKTFKM